MYEGEAIANWCHQPTLSLGQSHIGWKLPCHCAATEAKWRRGGAATEARRPREPVAEAGAWCERRQAREAGGGGKRQGGEGREEVVAWSSTSEAQQRHWRPATISAATIFSQNHFQQQQFSAATIFRHNAFSAVPKAFSAGHNLWVSSSVLFCSHNKGIFPSHFWVYLHTSHIQTLSLSIIHLRYIINLDSLGLRWDLQLSQFVKWYANCLKCIPGIPEGRRGWVVLARIGRDVPD